MRRSAITAFALLTAPSLATAQAPPHAACPPTFELGGGMPPRLAQRLRRVLDHASTALPAHASCQPSRARIEWNARELTLRISLDDGRMAVRNLESLEDVLPTLLSVLAVPTPEPAPADPAPVDEAPALEAEAEAPPPAAPVAPPVAPVVPVRPPAPRSTWSLFVSGTIGAVHADGDLHGRWTAEVGVATPRLALTLRAGMSFARGNDDDESLRNPFSIRWSDRGRTQSLMVLSARARWNLGRFSLEAGGSGGVSHDAAAEPSSWMPRLGVEAALGWHISRAFIAFVRAEGSVDMGADEAPAAALSLGLSWEPHR